MGSDMYMNPPKPVWEWQEYDTQEDALLAISVAWENGWKVQASYDPKLLLGAYRVGFHKGEYI